MEVYSHRGIGLGSENSLISMKEAKKRGLKYETDIRKSKDKKLMLYHDRGLVENKSSIELETVGIASLEHALQMGLDLDLDIKEGVKGADVLALVEQHNMVEHVIFTSFYPWKVMDIKRRNKEAAVGIITQMKIPQATLPLLAKAGMDYILPHADIISKNFVDRAHESGLKVITWYRSDEKTKPHNNNYGIDGTILNF